MQLTEWNENTYHLFTILVNESRFKFNYETIWGKINWGFKEQLNCNFNFNITEDKEKWCFSRGDCENLISGLNNNGTFFATRHIDESDMRIGIRVLINFNFFNDYLCLKTSFLFKKLYKTEPERQYTSLVCPLAYDWLMISDIAYSLLNTNTNNLWAQSQNTHRHHSV